MRMDVTGPRRAEACWIPDPAGGAAGVACDAGAVQATTSMRRS